MKTQYLIKKEILHKLFFTTLFLVAVNLSFAQQTPTTDPTNDAINDTVKGYNVGQIAMPNPKSVVEAYTYDPVSDRYILNKTFDGFNINYPIMLTPKEYQKMVQKEAMRKYFQDKNDAIAGVKPGSDAAKKNLLPKYYVNSNFFSTIFGSNTIDVKPTGSVEIDLGMRHTKQDNPAISPRNRVSNTFDFNQRINMGLKGKVGTRLGVNMNYDTHSTFAFQNLIKLQYDPSASGGEDSILKKIEVGNISMPLTSSLIRGAQSLFGVKAQFQFGKTTITGVFSEQKSQTKTVTAQGGGTIQDFNVYAQEYDANRHFFLSQYFRSRYDYAMKNYPFINSRVQITRVEVWITNKQNRVTGTNNNLRNIVAIQDLGETKLTDPATNDPLDTNELIITNPTDWGSLLLPSVSINNPPDNSNNAYDPNKIGAAGYLLNSNIRQISSANQGFNNSIATNEGTDFAKLENARKLLPTEFTFNPQLGYISLQQRLASDEVLAVAFQYTMGDKVYQVGEFGSDGVDATQVSPTGIPTSQAIILKLLKSTISNVDRVVSAAGVVPEVRATTPIWNIMMKNIYQIPGAYQLQKEDFKFNILYTNPSPLNYITLVNPLPSPDNITQTPLLKVFNVDKLNYNNDPQDGGDGFFDFIPGLTVDQQNGRIIFTSVEPFGKTLFEKLRSNPAENYNGDSTITTNYNTNQAKYVYTELYKKTPTTALQYPEKNKFLLRGKFKSTGADGIPLGAFNVPKGSVVVTAGGRVLMEGIDYTVNYQAGRVQILDPALKASNTPIQVSVENNSVFGQKTKRFVGINVDHQFSKNFLLGATYLKLTEKPFTQKSDYGQESVNNTVYGLHTSYSSEVPFLTRLVNKLPNIDTDVPSNVSVKAEIAFLKPGSPKAGNFNGVPTIYVEDFDGAQTSIDMRSPQSWFLSSVPEKPTTGVLPPYNDFGATNSLVDYGYKRAKLSWYSIDPIFYTQTPSGISQDDLSLNATRRVYSSELYPDLQLSQGQSTVVNTLDLTYNPKERGPYNFNPATTSGNILPNPTDNFGGIVRSLNTTNFQQSNVEFIQFWMLDPYYDTRVSATPINPTNTGKIYFNLGEISEDILKDGNKFYENGIGGTQIVKSPQPMWGDVPASQSLIYAFDTDPNIRPAQDVGLNGLNDAQEAAKFPAFASYADPAADDYQYYLQGDGDVLNRYKNYNGTEGNSPINVSDTNRGSTTIPDVEDINRDNTMNTINAYFEYGIDIKPNMNVGNTKYVTAVREATNVTLPNGETTNARWIQFKIPVNQPDNVVGGISDFTSIRFMRMFLTGFNAPITTRFGSLDLVRSDWITYHNSLDPLDTNPNDDNTNFEALTVSLQLDGTRAPIPYVMPPGVSREQVYSGNTLIAQNESSLSLRVSGDGLETGDSRAVFKNVNVDMRQYKRLKMFLHEEALPDTPNSVEDNEMSGFMRFGNDFTDNFYQVEIPLTKTQFGAATADQIWPDSNQIDLALSSLTEMKIHALSINAASLPPGGIYYPDDDASLPNGDGDPKLRLGIKGNPNFGMVRTLMVGVKNRTNVTPLAPRKVKGEVWFDELRMAEMDNKGGMAAIANIDANAADFATLSAMGKMSTIGWGTIEQTSMDRSRDDTRQYNIVTNFSLGKLLPKKWGINLPFNYSVGEDHITPKYDPFNQDIELKQLLDVTTDAAARSNIKQRAMDFTKRRSINFIGVKKERGEKQKSHFYDPENVTLSYSYNQVERHNYELDNYLDQQVSTTADYNYAFTAKPLEPLKNVKTFKKSDYWKLLKDFNFNYLPSTINFNTNIMRQYNRQQFRLVDVEGIGLDPLYKRNYLFNYQYGFNYNLTKSLKVNFTATTNNIVRNYMNDFNQPINSYTLFTDYWNIGSANRHTQQVAVNYELPLNKLPFLTFLKSSYTYTGNYSWQASSLAMRSVTDDATGISYNLGNLVQNSGAHKLNSTLDMSSFYKYIGFTKDKKIVPPKPAAPKPGEKVAPIKTQVAQDAHPLKDFLIGVATSLKTVNINYTENKGTALPGYLPGLGFFGTDKPTLGFVFGSQDDVRYEAAKNGWLTNYPNFAQNYTQITTKTLDYTANMVLFPDFTIDLTANRTFANNYSEQYNVTDNNYQSLTPYYTGNFAISTVMLKTSFRNSDEFGSSPFNDFRNNRLIVADRLAESFYGAGNIPRYGDALHPIPTATTDPNYTIYNDNAGYPIGFGRTSQEVLMPSFLAAYTGLGITNNKKGQAAENVSTGLFRNFPLPNWNIKYTGLMHYNFFKENFKRFSIQHAYQASYTLNSFRSNLNYATNAGQINPLNGNFYSPSLIGNVNLVERFNPLLKIDLETKSSLKFLAELKKDRALSMSFDNNLLTEVKGIEYVLGMGYRIKDVIFSTKLADDPTGIIRSDINLKLDFSYRNNKTIVRYLDYNNNQLGGGQNIWQAKFTADYAFSKSLTLIFYYDHMFSKAVISTSFPMTTVRTGFTLRYNFGN